jgi:hypothetical protein
MGRWGLEETPMLYVVVNRAGEPIAEAIPQADWDEMQTRLAEENAE